MATMKDNILLAIASLLVGFTVFVLAIKLFATFFPVTEHQQWIAMFDALTEEEQKEFLEIARTLAKKNDK